MSTKYNDLEENKKNEEVSTEQMDVVLILANCIKGLKKFWLLILVLISICSSVLYFQAKSNYVPKYYSAISFVVNTKMSVSYSSSYYNNATAEQLAKSFPYIIMNSALRHVIAQDLGMGWVPGEIEATAMSGTNLITISVTANDPQLSYDILQSVIKNYPKIAKSVIGNSELIVIDETGVPRGPMNGDGARSAAKKGIMLGLALGAMIVLLYVITRRTIATEKELRELLNIKCLGELPRVAVKKRSKMDGVRILMNAKNVSYGFVEANRTIRTRIERDAAEHNAKVYMISGSIAKEGKSTVACNVALSLADKGLKVIMVDMDLRNPSVHRVLGLEKKKIGVIDVLLGTVEISEVMERYEETNLHVLLGAESTSASIDRALQAENLGRLLDELRREADYVIIDTPPSGLLADATRIVQCVDAGIFVVRQDHASKDRIVDGIEMLADAGLRICGCILNCVDDGIAGYGSKYTKYTKYYGKYGKSKYELEEE